MKNITITADWILNNFSESNFCCKDGWCSIKCSLSDAKWNILALQEIDFTYNEIKERDRHFAHIHFKIEPLKEIAPEFYSHMMEVNNLTK